MAYHSLSLPLPWTPVAIASHSLGLNSLGLPLLGPPNPFFSHCLTLQLSESPNHLVSTQCSLPLAGPLLSLPSALSASHYLSLHSFPPTLWASTHHSILLSGPPTHQASHFPGPLLCVPPFIGPLSPLASKRGRPISVVGLIFLPTYTIPYDFLSPAILRQTSKARPPRNCWEIVSVLHHGTKAKPGDDQSPASPPRLFNPCPLQLLCQVSTLHAVKAWSVMSQLLGSHVGQLSH